MIRTALAVLVGMTLLAAPALAWPMAMNQRIDRTLYPGHDAPTIVAGTIEAHLVDALAEEAREFYPPLSELVFEVEHVLLGDDAKTGSRLRFSTRSFAWPADLVPMKRGAKAFLIYDPRKEEGFDGYVVTVVPWSGKAPGPAGDRTEAQQILASELIAVLARESDPVRRRAVVLQMLPIVTPEQAEAAFVPLLEASDVWLRRAAVAGLAYASPKAEHVERAAADLAEFIRHTPAKATIDFQEDGVVAGFAAYSLLFGYYAFLDTNWSEEERQRLGHCLPLFRTVARELGKEPHYQWEYGIRPLSLLGTKEDLPLLLTYYRDHETRREGVVGHRAYVRLTVMRKLAELLGVELVASEQAGTIRNEAEQQRLFREALDSQVRDRK